MSAPAATPHPLTASALADLGLSFALEPHPVIPQIPVEEFLEGGLTARELMPLLAQRHELLAKERPKTPGNVIGDPLRHGWEPAMWHRVDRVIADIRRENPSGVVEILIMGSWQSGKTTYCGKRLMQRLVQFPGSKAVFMQEKESASKERQQKVLWDFMPNELKDVGTGRLKRRVDTKIVYKQGDGFSNNQFVLPNVGPSGEGSDARAFFYSMDTASMQGDQYDIAWLDELAKKAHVETMRGRLFRKNGLLLVSFTPLEGYTDTVGEWLDGVEFVNGIPMGYAAGKTADGRTRYEGVEEWAPAPLLGPRPPWQRPTDRPDAAGYDPDSEHELVPLVLRCRHRMRFVVWFHNNENFYGNYSALVTKLQGAKRDQILIEAYGIPTKRYGAIFKFYETNIVSGDARMDLLRRAHEYSWYQVFDPAGLGVARNGFAQWWAKAQNGQKICVREWPEPEDYIPGVGKDKGVWALSGSKADGERGPAQEWFGFGFERMSEEFRRVEEELAAHCPELLTAAKKTGAKPRIAVRERYMDSRAGHSTTMTYTGGITLIQQFEMLPPSHRLFFLPASGDGGDNWKVIVQSQLEPSDLLGGAPQLLICENCRNTIFGLRNWTNEDGNEGACKDPVDCTHYIVSLDPPWVEGGTRSVTSGGLTTTTVQPGKWHGYGQNRRN